MPFCFVQKKITNTLCISDEIAESCTSRLPKYILDFATGEDSGKAEEIKWKLKVEAIKTVVNKRTFYYLDLVNNM